MDGRNPLVQFGLPVAGFVLALMVNSAWKGPTPVQSQNGPAPSPAPAPTPGPTPGPAPGPQPAPSPGGGDTAEQAKLRAALEQKFAQVETALASRLQAERALEASGRARDFAFWVSLVQYPSGTCHQLLLPCLNGQLQVAKGLGYDADADGKISRLVPDLEAIKPGRVGANEASVRNAQAVRDRTWEVIRKLQQELLDRLK